MYDWLWQGIICSLFAAILFFLADYSIRLIIKKCRYKNILKYCTEKYVFIPNKNVLKQEYIIYHMLPQSVPPSPERIELITKGIFPHGDEVSRTSTNLVDEILRLGLVYKVYLYEVKKVINGQIVTAKNNDFSLIRYKK